jgi:hypothetical protein
MRETGNTYKILDGKCEAKRNFGNIDVGGRII